MQRIAQHRSAAELRSHVPHVAITRWMKSHLWDIAIFDATLLLCVPSLLGGVAFVFSIVLYGNIEDWSDTASALVALAVFLGGPMVSLAAVIGALTAFSRKIPASLKYANLAIVSIATISWISVLLRFRR